MRIEGMGVVLDGEGGFSGPFTRSWSGALGDVSEGTVSDLQKRTVKLRGDVAKAQNELGKAQFKLDDARKPKWRRHWLKIRNARARTLEANRRQLATAIAAYNEARAELAQQQASEAASDASGGGPAPTPAGGGGDGGEAASDDPSTGAEPSTEGLGAIIEQGARIAGLGYDEAAGLGGLFSGAGEPAWLPLGKLGTPAALAAAWWFLFRKRRRR